MKEGQCIYRYCLYCNKKTEHVVVDSFWDSSDTPVRVLFTIFTLGVAWSNSHHVMCTDCNYIKTINE